MHPSPRAAFVSVSCLALLLMVTTALSAQSNSQETQSASTLSASAVLQPADLAKTLQTGKNKQLILNVGPRMLYVQAHIPGAEFIGAGSDPEALSRLRARVQKVPLDTAIVLYCGCCPWTRCPNVAPAYSELQKLGFKNVKVLYIADNFGADWVYKGYPTASGNQ